LGKNWEQKSQGGTGNQRLSYSVRSFLLPKFLKGFYIWIGVQTSFTKNLPKLPGKGRKTYFKKGFLGIEVFLQE